MENATEVGLFNYVIFHSFLHIIKSAWKILRSSLARTMHELEIGKLSVLTLVPESRNLNEDKLPMATMFYLVSVQS